MEQSNMTALEQAALACLEAHRDGLYTMLIDLIGFDTQNFGTDGREAACAPFLEKLYKDLGLETEIYYPDQIPGLTESSLYWPGQNTDRRPNISGILRGRSEEGRVMLAAHTDTMPAGDLSDWDRSPFEGVIKDGRIYGLGACDDKFGLAGSYWAVKVLKLMGIELERTVVLTAYCDEEFGGGNGALAACMKHPCGVYVNLDGGGYQMWATALGGGCFKLRLHLTRTSDDCMPVYRVLAAFMTELDAFGQRCRDRLEKNPFYSGTAIAKSAFRVSGAGCVGSAHTDAEVSFVLYTDQTREAVEEELRGIFQKLLPVMEEAGVVSDGFQNTSRFFQYGQSDQGHPAFQIMRRCAEDAAGREVEVRGSCLTDLSAIMAAGGTDACFNFGILRDFSLPGGAHQPNEYVDCQELMNFTKALLLFLLRYGKPQSGSDITQRVPNTARSAT